LRSQIQIFERKIETSQPIMKLIIVSLLAAVLAPCAVANFVVSISSHDEAAVHPAKACERETQINVEEALSEAMLETVDGMSSDDGGRSLALALDGMTYYCYIRCPKVQPGWCGLYWPR
jgi:hypothetical protein